MSSTNAFLCNFTPSHQQSSSPVQVNVPLQEGHIFVFIFIRAYRSTVTLTQFIFPPMGGFILETFMLHFSSLSPNSL